MLIVSALIAGLVAIQLPIYQQYKIRSRVAEGLVISRDIRMVIVENAVAGLPLNSNTPGVGRPAFTETPTVKDITVDENGEITITYQPNAGDGTLVVAPTVGLSALTTGVVPLGNIVWNCNSAASRKPGSKGTLHPKYAPADCRD